MEEFTNDIQKLLKTSSFSELSTNMELLNNFSELNQLLSSHALEYFSSEGLMSNSNISQPPYRTVEVPKVHSLFCSAEQHSANISRFLSSSVGDFGVQRSENDTVPVSEFPETPSSPVPGSESGGHYMMTDKHTVTGGRKRKRKSQADGKKPREVIHVRAKRGQATDSHSLAERVRRERINEKLKVLQDLVPGCYKTMGMAVMLDVIINYVRSLQNQIEFLSMKLSAASMFYDFNSPEAEAIDTLQRTANPCDAYDMERCAREGYSGMLPRLQSTWPF